jgi:hypothetical protein
LDLKHIVVMPIAVDPMNVANDLARAMVADIMESCTPEEIRQLIEEMEARRRKPH